MPPSSTAIRQQDTHRLIPSKYSEDEGSVLTRIAEDNAHLQDIFTLDHATNDRLMAENGLLPGIRQYELIFGVPYYRIVNAAFCHASPLGNRFNGPDRGAWYAAFSLDTSKKEVSFHRELEFAEIGWNQVEIGSYDDYLADFSGEFHDIRTDSNYKACLIPNDYRTSQKLAEDLLKNDSLGVIYPSVRDPNGTCLVCFRPPMVTNVRKDKTHIYRWNPTARSISWE